MIDVTLLKERLQAVRQTLNEASEGRFPPPRLIVVTKTHPPEDILPLFDLGVTDVGQNRVQEITEKLPCLEGRCRIHCIGRLQTNKVKYLMGHVSMIHSVDRLELARQIDRQSPKHGGPVPVLIQVSPAGEEQKGGLPPQELIPFLRECARLPGLRVKGLMAVMPNTPDRSLLNRLFGEMRMLFDQCRQEAIQGIEMEELSMGMSGDYDLAAANGATLVRVGSAILGPRSYDMPQV